jgi:hypothetical protein
MRRLPIRTASRRASVRGRVRWPGCVLGPSLRELAVQALSSVEGGYDLLCPEVRLHAFPHLRRRAGCDRRRAALVRPVRPGTGRVLRPRRGPPGPRVPVPGAGHGHRFQRWHARAGAQARSAHPDAGWVQANARARRPSPRAGTGHCSGPTWPCGFAMPSGGLRSSCTAGPARRPRSAATWQHQGSP